MCGQQAAGSRQRSLTMQMQIDVVRAPVISRVQREEQHDVFDNLDIYIFVYKYVFFHQADQSDNCPSALCIMIHKLP